MCLSVVYVNMLHELYEIFDPSSFEGILTSYLDMLKNYQALNEYAENESES